MFIFGLLPEVLKSCRMGAGSPHFIIKTEKKN
jgi:hypothetical protein